ncbi:MAG: hypothetical protein AMXMBFR64_32240 [Myxococcales bacterium]
MVQEGEIEGTRQREAPALDRVGSLRDGVSASLEEAVHQSADEELVIYDQDVHRSTPVCGIATPDPLSV